MAAIGIVSVSLGLLAVGVLLNGFVLSILWGWFIVGVFGLPALTVGQAIGVSMVIGFLTYQQTHDSAKKSWAEVLSAGLGLAILKPLITLAFGWVVYTVAF